MRRLIPIILAGALALAPTSALAQQRSPNWFERTFGIDLRGPLCLIGQTVVGNVLGTTAATVATSVAETLGLCPTATTIPTPPAGEPASVAALPGLQVRVIAVKGTAADPVLSPGTPETVYANGEGFALVVAANASGYLEIWSIDGAGGKFVEGIVLDPTKASVVTLPMVVDGAYRFSTNGGADTLRLKYHPCRHTAPEEFGAVANARVAAAIDASPIVTTMNQTLPTCSFASTINRSVPQHDLFTSIREMRASYSIASGAYTAVLDRSQITNARSIAMDIELLRK